MNPRIRLITLPTEGQLKRTFRSRVRSEVAKNTLQTVNSD